MLRLVMKARTAPPVLALALVCATAACGAEEPRPSAASFPEVRGSKLAIQRRADGLEQISLRGRPQHVTVARAGQDGGLQRACAHGDESAP